VEFSLRPCDWERETIGSYFEEESKWQREEWIISKRKREKEKRKN